MNRKDKRFLAWVLTVTFSASLSMGINFRRTSAEEVETKDVKAALSKEMSRKFSPKDVQNKLKEKYGTEGNFNDNAPLKHNDPEEVVRVVIQMKDKPLLQGIKSEKKEDKNIKSLINSKKSEADDLKKQQDEVIAKVKTLKGAEIRHNYFYTANGFSMDVKRGEIDKLKNIPGVKSVKEANRYVPDMTYAKSLTQTYDVWKDYGYKGEGTVVAVIDSGIDVNHKDMRLTDPSKAKISKNNAIISKEPGKFYSIKVPYAYNFADGNDDILDTNPNTGMHGMHVAGIVAANGEKSQVDQSKAIQGVAPEAQVLALRVFSNRPEEKYAYSDDIAAAIESAVLHEADVINMSLGSDAGFQDPEDIEQQAIKIAANEGLIVVVSAGNSAYSTYQSKYKEVVDTGVVGSPGIAEDTLQVASYENNKIIASVLEYSAGSDKGKIAYTPTDINPVGRLTGEYNLVDCNLGVEQDFKGKDLRGKIALVKRGSITFVEKQLNAQKAGAAGIIVYNRDGEEDYVKMAGDPSITIPGMFVKNSDGVKLKDFIGKAVKVSFKGDLMPIDNASNGDMSDFTSWGPAPNLEFKPQITAPGGQIYSTVNNNSYEVMSGTSMAAPHTAGAEALLVQAIKAKGMNISGRKMMEFAKTTSVNTAVPKFDKNGVPFSPRRQGAGLVQIKDAITNTVTVTDEYGDGVVALREIDKVKTFKLKLTNYGEKEVSYNLSDNGGVLTEVEEAEGMSYDVKIHEASVSFNPNTITVPENSSKEVYVTIKLPENFKRNQFVEGFIKFNSNTSGAPSLNVPYMGFYGNWSKMNVVDLPMWDSNSVYGTTTLLSKVDNDLVYLGYDGEDDLGNPKVNAKKIAISPDEDGYNDEAIPYLVFLRNARTMNIAVVDSKGMMVRDLKTEEYLNKDIIAEQQGNVGRYSPDWSWDGKIKNSEGQLEVKEGQYFIRVRSKVDYEKADWQELNMPVKVDITAPKIQITSSNTAHTGKYTLKWTAKDNLSGIGIQGVMLNKKLLRNTPINDLGNGQYSCNIDLKQGNNTIEIISIDNAGNEAHEEFAVNYIPFNIQFDNLSEGIKINTREYTVTGRLNYAVKDLFIKGVNAVINEDLTFSAMITLPDTINDVNIKAIDFDNQVLKDYTLKVYCDTVPPTMTFESPKVDGDGKVYTNKDQITVAGTVFDDTFGYKFYVNGELKMEVNLPEIGGEQGTKREFSYEVPVTNGCKVEVKAVDLFGNETPVKVFDIVLDKETPVITINGVENGKAYNHDLLPEISVNEGILTVTLNGKEYKNEAITEEGSYELVAKALDKAGNSSEVKVNFIIDKTSPEITIKGVEDGKYYNTDVTPIVTANEGTIAMTLNKKDYKGEAIKDEGEYELVVTAIDAAGNKTEKTVKFVIDKTNPEITIKGVEDGKHYNTDVTPVVTVNEGTFTMALNGKDYKGETIKDEGKYELIVTALDKTGNKAEKTVKFVIDKTNPEITIKGVEDGKTYTTSVKPEIKTSKGNLIITLNGKEYKGEEITAVCSYEIIAKAVDLAGNTTTKVVKFKIEKPKTDEQNSNPTNNNPKEIVKTGSRVSMNLLIAVGASLVAIGTCFIIYKKKNRKTA